MAKFTAHSIGYYYKDYNGNTVGTANTAFGALTSVDLPLNTETDGDDSGAIYDEARYVISQIPEFSFTTKAIDVLLQLTGLNGACFDGASPTDGITIYGQLVHDCKDRPAVTNNAKILITRGLIRATTLNGPRTEDATVNFTIDPIWDGGSTPVIAVFENVTLPNVAMSNKYTLGHSEIDGQSIEDPLSINLDFGLTLFEKLPALGHIWPETVGVQKVQPVMTVRTRDRSIFNVSTGGSGVLMRGAEADHVNTTIQFKRRATLNAFHDNIGGQHFNYTMHGLFIPNNPFSSSGNDIAELEARVEGTNDGSNAPVLFGFGVNYDPTL